MKSNQKTLPASNWIPHQIGHVQCDDAPNLRTGFIGRAAAMFINGTDCIVLCKNDFDLMLVGKELTHSKFDDTQIYKATLIQSVGIDVVMPEEVEPVIVSGDTLVITGAQDAMQERDESERQGMVVNEDGTPTRADGVAVAKYGTLDDETAAAFADAPKAPADDEL